MKKILLIFLIGTTILNLGCSGSDDLENEELYFRIKNSSNQEYHQIKFGFADENYFSMESLSPGKAILHSRVDSFPEIKTINLVINGEKFSLDQKENAELENYRSGSFTVAISVLNEENKLLQYSIDPDQYPNLE